MKSDKATTIGLGLVMAMSSAAHADTLQNIIDKGEVAIGVKADFAPWGALLHKSCEGFIL